MHQEHIDHWTHFLLSLLASVPALLAAIAAFIQSLRNGSKVDAASDKVAAVHTEIKSIKKASDGCYTDNLGPA